MDKSRNQFRLIILSATLLIILGCYPIGAGFSRGKIQFDDLQYPASMSPYLYGPREEILAESKDLVVIKKFRFEKNSWNLMYGLISLANNNDIAERINHEISLSGGDGILNVEITTKNGIMNYIYILNLLPLWPTYTKLTVEGDIVKYVNVSLTQ
jgi:hypothetical protein